MRYECVGKDCDATLASDDPELCDTGWARLYVTPKATGVKERTEMAICSSCCEKPAKEKRDKRNAKRREKRAARKAAES